MQTLGVSDNTKNQKEGIVKEEIDDIVVHSTPTAKCWLRCREREEKKRKEDGGLIMSRGIRQWLWAQRAGGIDGSWFQH